MDTLRTIWSVILILVLMAIFIIGFVIVIIGDDSFEVLKGIGLMLAPFLGFVTHTLLGIADHIEGLVENSDDLNDMFAKTLKRRQQ